MSTEEPLRGRKVSPGHIYGWDCIPEKNYHVWLENDMCLCGRVLRDGSEVVEWPVS